MATVMRVTGAWIRLLSDWLDANQLAAPELRARISRWPADDMVPLPVWQRLLNDGLQLADDLPAPELAVGALVQPRHVGVLGYLVLATDTLGEALMAYQRYEKLFYGVGLAEVAVEGKSIDIRWRKETAELGQQGDGVAIAALITFLRNQISNPPPLDLVTFAHPLSDSVLSAYETFFECPVRGDDPFIRVRFPLSYLGIAMPHSDPGLKALLARQADALMRAQPNSSEFEKALQQVLLRLLAEGAPTLARAAQVMHMTARTLQRRLARQGLTWQQWLDSNREQLACEYLADPGLSLSDIALLLAFSEQSAFNRAFRRWTGTTPAHYRRSLI